ncbi:MAG: DUF305 domain-containing protein [Nostocales cyanobacterium]|nr:MAG: DUF305 domain-containing protein [Nostocales cyanobacterium]
MNCMAAMGKNGSTSMMGLASLANSPNFDQEFVKKIIYHQQMSVKMTKKTAKIANLPQICNLAEAIIKTQTNQIQKLKKLVVES